MKWSGRKMTSVTRDDLVKLSPVVYHATYSENLRSVVQEGTLMSPGELQRRRGTTANTAPRKSRSGSVKFKIPLGDGFVHWCDHDRLCDGHIEFEIGWDIRRFIDRLNALVFFWPCDRGGPIKQGLLHRERYAAEGRSFVVIRIPLNDLIEQNGPPLLSSCNSGAPRHHPQSGKQPRGSATFRPLDQFGVRERLVEVVFESKVVLPDSSMIADSYDRPWHPLFTS